MLVCVFQKYLQNASDHHIQKIQDNIRLNLFLNTDFKKWTKSKQNFLFKFGRFPAINELTVVPMGDVSKFVNSNDVISPSELCEKFNLENSRELVCVHFLAVLNIHLGGEKIISKNAMSESVNHLSMQALSKSNNKTFINFYAINWLNKNINNLMIGEIHAFEEQKISTMLEDFDGPIFVANRQTYNKKNRK